MNKIFAERFYSARILKGYSLQDVADKLPLSISKQALHKYEKGEVMPDSEMIDALASTLSVHPNFFFRTNEVKFDRIEFRKLKTLTIKDEQRIVEETRDAMARYIELERFLNIETNFINPLQAKITKIENLEHIEEAARIVRREWKLGIDPIPNCLTLLEENHIKVIEVFAGDSFNGMQSVIDNKYPVIVLNRDKAVSLDRQRFTAIHELAHLILPIHDLPEGQKETICHQFAAAFLFPKETAFKELGNHRSKLLIQELGVLKQQFGISIQAIVMRAKDLEIISKAYAGQFFGYLKQMEWKVNEPYSLIGSEESKRFMQLLFRSLAEDIITLSKAASLNNQSDSEFREQYLTNFESY